MPPKSLHWVKFRLSKFRRLWEQSNNYLSSNQDLEVMKLWSQDRKSKQDNHELALYNLWWSVLVPYICVSLSKEWPDQTPYHTGIEIPEVLMGTAIIIIIIIIHYAICPLKMDSEAVGKCLGCWDERGHNPVFWWPVDRDHKWLGIQDKPRIIIDIEICFIILYMLQFKLFELTRWKDPRLGPSVEKYSLKKWYGICRRAGRAWCAGVDSQTKIWASLTSEQRCLEQKNMHQL